MIITTLAIDRRWMFQSSQHTLKGFGQNERDCKGLNHLKSSDYEILSLYSHPSIIPQLSCNYQKATLAIICVVSRWNTVTVWFLKGKQLCLFWKATWTALVAAWVVPLTLSSSHFHPAAEKKEIQPQNQVFRHEPLNNHSPTLLNVTD